MPSRKQRVQLMEFETTNAAPATRNPRSVRSLLIIVGLGFLAGLVAMGWGLSRWDTARNWLLGEPKPAPQAVVTYAPPVNAPIAGQGAADAAGRLAAIEARMAKVEAAGTVASGSGGSVRAEGLLVSFAARRAIDRGIGLGYVEGLLTQRFGSTQPRAVATIIAASRNPATLDQLKAGLDAIAPDLVGGGPDEGWWTSFKRGVAGMFVVRQAGVASPDPNARVARARDLVETGRVDLALAEISRLPNQDKAAKWIAAARRHVEAHRALDLLEAAAITAGEAPSAGPDPEVRTETVKEPTSTTL